MSRIPKILLLWLLAVSAGAQTVGLLPTPSVKDVQISTTATFDPFNGYAYSYTVTSSPKNVGEIVDFRIDMTAGPSGNSAGSFGLTIPLGSNRFDFFDLFSSLLSLNASVSTPALVFFSSIVPFGQNVPTGWNGGLGVGGFAGFSPQAGVSGIMPGSTLSGFQLLSFGVPTIRNVQFVPFWMHVVDNHETVTQADLQAAGQLEQSIIFNTITLGASGVSYGSFAHWNRLRDDLARAVQINWISDNQLAKTLTAQLATARQTLESHDLFTTKPQLQTLLDTINRSTPKQRTSEGFALVALNVQSLIDNTPDNLTEPQITIFLRQRLCQWGAPRRLPPP